MGYNTHLAFFKGNKMLLFFLRRSKFLFLHFSMISLWKIKKKRRNGEVTFIMKKHYFFPKSDYRSEPVFREKNKEERLSVHYNQSRTFANSHALYMYQTADLKERSQFHGREQLRKKVL
jgi:hypothetical protein